MGSQYKDMKKLEEEYLKVGLAMGEMSEEFTVKPETVCDNSCRDTESTMCRKRAG
jgi:hypothetical protein